MSHAEKLWDYSFMGLHLIKRRQCNEMITPVLHLIKHMCVIYECIDTLAPSCTTGAVCHIIYLLGKRGYVFGSVGLSVCLFVCGQHYSKTYKRIVMKCYGRGPG